MPKQRIWELFPTSYRAEQMQQLAKLIYAGENCSVVGLVGCGRSNLLQFLCYRPEILQSYLPADHDAVISILVDLNDLPATDPTTLYLVILREFYWARSRFSETIRTTITDLFTEYRATQNPFLAQTALHEFILTCRAEQTQVVLVLNHFDTFAQLVPRQTLATLRSLRDKFKDSLFYISGMMQEFRYLPTMGELVSRNICWVGPMNEADARNLIERSTRTAASPPTDDEIRQLIDLTGGFPALLRAASHWWLNEREPASSQPWLEVLQQTEQIDYWLKRLWNSVSEEEKFTLTAIKEGQQTIERTQKQQDKAIKSITNKLEQDHTPTLTTLERKGMCYKNEKGWQLMGQLFAAYIDSTGEKGLGKIWYNSKEEQFWQGETPLKLAKQEMKLLHYFNDRPGQHLTYIELTQHIWPKNVFVDDQGKLIAPEGFNPLFKLIGRLRAKIKDDAATEHYIVNNKGDDRTPSGYIFYPEGRPSEAKADQNL